MGGLFYIVLHHVQPFAFSIGGSTSPTSGERQIIPLLFYFCLSTLSTIGGGNIIPLTLQARYAAAAEGITGQFYLAILVARVVGMQMSSAASRHRTAPQNYAIALTELLFTDNREVFPEREAFLLKLQAMLSVDKNVE
jgi:hypothetical protein